MPLTSINRVPFYKIDEITTDLICCEISTAEGVWTYHENREDWKQLISQLEAIPSCVRDWPGKVIHSPFAPTAFVAYERTTP
jgi:hypothetical protein